VDVGGSGSCQVTGFNFRILELRVLLPEYYLINDLDLCEIVC
jgi:hypothetical protein